MKRKNHSPYWKLRFNGKNDNLANDLRSICAVLNYRIVLKKRIVKYQFGESIAYDGWIRTNNMVAKYNETDLEKIIQIKKEKKKIAYDIQVSGDHLFCLANGIQTHNSLVAAILNATAASDIFTQDIEDMPPEVINATVVKESKKSSQKAPKPPQSTQDEKAMSDIKEEKKKDWPTKKAFIEDLKSYQEKLGEDVYADMLAKHDVSPSELNKLDNIKGPALYDDLAKAYEQL